jgi:hypothetical protein
MMLLLPGFFIGGLLTYLILSYLHIPTTISLPLSILISTLIFGLNNYYFFPRKNMKENRKIGENDIKGSSYVYGPLDFFFIWVYGILLLLLFLTSVSEQAEFRSYIPWGQMTSFDIVNLANAIAFSFFLPGYGLVVLLDKNRKLALQIKLLLAYLISILLVAFPTYTGASFGYSMTDVELFIIALYAVIFILFLFQKLTISNTDFFGLWATLNREPLSQIYAELKNRIPESVVFASLFSLIVFYTYYLNDNHIVVDQWFHHGRALLIGSEVYKEIASAENYEDPYTDFGSDITQIYPPIFSSLLFGYFNLSNSASVNAYVSIGFLNVMPIFAFYYFFTSWVPQKVQRAALLATTLFVLSSGFGWIYAIDLAVISPPSNEKQPELSSIDIISDATDITYDIGLPTTFINVGHPDITTPLIIIALPAGFTLLIMIKEVMVKRGEGEGPSIIDKNANKAKTHTTVVPAGRFKLIMLKRLTGTTIGIALLMTLISFLGILSHDEYYLFIIIACVSIVVFLAKPSANQSFKKLKISFRNTFVYGYSISFSSFLVAIFMVVLVDTFISPVKYYITREIVGFSLILLCFIFVLFTWVTYLAIYVASSKRNNSFIHVKNSDASSNDDNTKLRVHRGALRRGFNYTISKMKEISGSRSRRIRNMLSINNSSSTSTDLYNDSGVDNLRINRAIRLVLRVSVVSVIVFFYLFTFLVWSQLSSMDIQSQVDTENEWNVPWYLYPMKFGVTGFLGLAFLLSCLFRKYEKEIFVFALVVVISLLAGPYYDEHRFGKYVMTGMAAFAALLIYGIISRPTSHLASIPLQVAKLQHFMKLRSKFKVVVSGILLGLVITSSSLSIFMFAGFVELFTNVEDYNEGTRRDFPTDSELQLLDFLHAGLVSQNSDKHYNIALPEKEVDNNRGFLTKIYGFTPIPRAKLLQTPLVLNASTIETFYNLLDYSGTKLIVLPKKDLSVDISSMSKIYPTGSIIHFALENFRKVFENDNYAVLEVPTLSPPSSEGDIALIYPKNQSQDKEETYYQHYYPLNMLALSNLDYNTYIEGDLSAFSKKYVMLTYDPFNDSDLSLSSSVESNYTGEEVDNSIYFDYVRNGGNLIVIDSANYGKYDVKERVQGVFSRLLSIGPTGNYGRFDSLSDSTSLQSMKNVTSKKGPNGSENQEQQALGITTSYENLNITGTVGRFLYDSNNTKDDNIGVKSYYTIKNNSISNKTDNDIVAPFTIEKKYGNGKITYVNAHGYFHTIFNELSSVNDSNNNNTYQINNKSYYFSTLSNIINLIDPNLALDRRFSNRSSLNAAASLPENSGAQQIRQILDNIQISSGFQTRINSSSLLLSISNNSNHDLAANDVTFASSSSRSASSPAINFSNENVTIYDLSYTDSSLQNNNESDKNYNYKHSAKDVKIRDLKMYGSYEVIVESNASSKLHFPAFPSFSDYVAINLPDGFDMTIKLSDSKPSYAEFGIMEDEDGGAATENGTFRKLRIYGSSMSKGLGLANVQSNEIHFHKTSSDLSTGEYTSLLMKSPQFQVKEEGVATVGLQRNYTENRPQENVNTILTFKSDSPDTEPIEIMNKVDSKESVIFRIDYVDGYSERESYNEGIKNHYLTYIEEDIKIVEDDIDDDSAETDRSTQYYINMPDIKLPADISDRAKKQGIDIQWQQTVTSDNGLLLAILIILTAILATKIATKMNSWPKPKFS